jgi:ADP-dependent phosphofructokinase/glucokinase
MIYKLTDGEFRRQEFLELVGLAKSEIIYHVRRMHFFAFDGYVMYTFECDNSDFNQKVLEAIGFSNFAWIE